MNSKNRTLISEFKKLIEEYSNLTALYSKDDNGKYQTFSFKQLYEWIKEFGSGLHELGIKRGDHIGIISDNMKEWIIASFGISGIGALDVPRGSDSTADEIKYILQHAECTTTLVENETQLEKVLSIKHDLNKLKTVIVMDPGFTKSDYKEKSVHIHNFKKILEKGKALLSKTPGFFDEEVAKGDEEDLATLIYTSGTTGEPKGVMLTHKNFLQQIPALKQYVKLGITDIALSVLPIWHVFERTVEYVILFSGSAIAYSKPIAKFMIADIEVIRPTVLPSVPRVWEAVRSGIYKKVTASGGAKKGIFDFFISVGALYAKLLNIFLGRIPQFKKRIRLLDILLTIIPIILLTPLKGLGYLLVYKSIQQKLGGRFRFGISGAGALPPHVDNFFAALGVLLLEGYGLTESAPVCSVRKEKHPVTNTIGPILPGVEFKILDEAGNELPPGQKGLLFVRGDNVMKGYYKKPEETKKVLSEDGWLNTGDLVMKTWKGELKILGRAKETIVLVGGENIEPEPIEEAIKQSDLIDQIMIVGQDQKYLGALVIPAFENLAAHAKSKGISFNKPEDLTEVEEIQNFYQDIINSYINEKKGFKGFEKVFCLALLKKPFEPGNEMTHSLKMKRNVIADIYKKEIDKMFK